MWSSFSGARQGDYAYVYLDGIVLKRSWGGEVKNISELAAIGVDQDGYRRILGVSEGHKEDKAGWLGFIKDLKQRGVEGCSINHLGCLSGAEGIDLRSLPGSRLVTMCRTFLPQCVLPRAVQEGA
jgi:transposase-like protein